jgi:hypothetical protein
MALANAPLRDDGLGDLGKLTALEKLSLQYTDVTDEGIKQLTGLKNLRYLDLSGHRRRRQRPGEDRHADRDRGAAAEFRAVDDERPEADRRADAAQTARPVAHRDHQSGMDAIGSLTNLEWLDLDHTRITDAGLAKLAGLTKLTELGLDSVELTDKGVVSLAGIGSLRELDLYHTLVTDKGFELLQKALPACRIHYERDSAKRERRS